MKNKKSTNKKTIKYSKNYQFETRVERVLDLLRKTHVATRENCVKYSKDMDKSISKNRFDTLLKLKYIKKEKVIDKETKEVHEVFKLDKRGKLYVKTFLKNTSIYSSNSTFHDLKQSNFLFENYSNAEIDSYKHEKELEELYLRDVDTSRPDGYLMREDGEGVYIETITKNYSKQKIDRKLSYCLLQKAAYHLNII